MKGTLWYRTMLENGFYDPVFGVERRQDLITYVNYQTKRYLIENQPLIGLVSDENIIKIVSLEATFFFNSRISDTGRWVYPTGFNQEELRLNDVFLTAMTANNDRFVKHNFNLVEYVATSYGILGVILLIIILILSLILVVVIQFSFPFFYVVLALLIIYRFLTDNIIRDLLKGYAKITLSVVSIYTIFIMIISCVPKLTSGMTMLVILLLAYIFLCFWLFVVFIGFFSDVMNMGNSGIIKALTANIVTGIIARPVKQFTDNAVSRLENDSLSTYIQNKESEDMTDMKDLHRQYIMRSLNDRDKD